MRPDQQRRGAVGHGDGPGRRTPEVVLEATYGWYWAVDALREQGAQVHLAHPLGVKAFEYRRVKNDERDARDLADLLRMGRLPEAWIAPPATRELRELVRHRAKLVGMRSNCKAQIHAVLAKCGIQVSMTDLFGLAGTDLLDRLELPKPYAARIASLRRIIDCLDFEIDVFAGQVRGRLARDPGYVAVQSIPGIGPILGAVFVAEVGDVHRFAHAQKLTCWAGLTPKHHESDKHVHRGRITKQGSRLVRWAAIESVQILPKTSVVGRIRDRVGAAADATSGWSRPPAGNSNSSSTPCATTTSAPTCAPRHRRRRRSRPRRPDRGTWPRDHPPELGRCAVVSVMTPTAPRPAPAGPVPAWSRPLD